MAGSYRLDFVERSGNCGPVPEKVIDANSATNMMMAGTCTGSSTISADKCTADYDTTCPVPGFAESVREQGTIHVAADGLMATATEQVTIMDGNGAVICWGTYDITFAKL
jgi:hypothetical protein